MLEFLIIISSVVILSVFTWHKISKRKFNKIFSEISARLGLQFKPGNPNLKYVPKNNKDLSVNIKNVKTNKSNIICINIKSKKNFPVYCSLIDRNNFSKVAKINKMSRIITGDVKFDNNIIIENINEKESAALLDSRTRTLILKIIRHLKVFNVSDNSITAYIQPVLNDEDYPVSNIDQDFITSIIWMTESLSKLAEYMLKDFSIDLLIKNSAEDPKPDIRIWNLRVLLKYFNKNKKTRQAVSDALNYTNKEVRLFAAQHAGEKGLEYIHKLLKSGNNKDKTEVVKVIRHIKNKASINPLIALFKISDNSEVKELIINTLETIGHTDAGDFLLKYLHKKDKLQPQIIKALGACGKLNAVEPLYYLSNSLNPSLKSEANKAVLKIQSRLGRGEKGSLSIPENSREEGALSIAEENGSLSIADD